MKRYFFQNKFLCLSSYRHPSFDVPEEVNERQKEALIYVNKQDEITNSDYRELFDVSRGTAYNDLKELIELGLLKKEGEGRVTRYVLRGSS